MRRGFLGVALVATGMAACFDPDALRAHAVDSGNPVIVDLAIDQSAQSVADLGFVDLSLVPDLSQPVDLAGADLAKPPSRCSDTTTPPTALYCADFESGYGPFTYSTQNASGNAAFDSTRSYRGQQSLHVWINAGAAGNVASSEIKIASVDATSGSHKVVRWFSYIPKAPLAGLSAPFFRFQQPVSPWDGLALNVDVNDHLVTYSAPASNIAPSTLTPPTGRWVCYEFDATFGDAGTGHVQVKMDDNVLSDLTFNGATYASPTLSNLILGIYYDANWNGQPWEMWIDEVYVADSPIGCAR
jgi:hypothetical protein